MSQYSNQPQSNNHNSNEYLDEDYCPNCNKNTRVAFYSAGHERDSSQDFRQCTVCRWVKLDHADEWEDNDGVPMYQNDY